MFYYNEYIDGLMRKGRNSSTLPMELRSFRIKPSIHEGEFYLEPQLIHKRDFHQIPRLDRYLTLHILHHEEYNISLSLACLTVTC